MHLHEVKDMVARGEGLTLEFKKKINFPEKVVREMAAFANTDGGSLIVGVEDNGTISGLRNPDEHDYALAKAVRDLSWPRIKYKKETIQLSEKKSILYYSINPAKKKPHYVKNSSADEFGKAYVRVEDKTVQASHEMTQILKRANGKKNFSFNYGDKEAVLMRLLDNKEEVTLFDFQEAARINRRTASTTLILLCLAGVLEIVPHDKFDLFKLKNI